MAAKTLGTFTIAVAPKLVFTTEPKTAVAGKAIAPAVVVTIEDQTGAVITTNTTGVTISLASGPSGGSVTGTTTVAAKAGVATFSNLLLTKAGTYTLKATDNGGTADSSAFVVTSGTPSGSVFPQSPTGSKTGQAISPAVPLPIEDGLTILA